MEISRVEPRHMKIPNTYMARQSQTTMSHSRFMLVLSAFPYRMSRDRQMKLNFYGHSRNRMKLREQLKLDASNVLGKLSKEFVSPSGEKTEFWTTNVGARYRVP